MCTEKYITIRCDNCGTGCEPVDVIEMTETELRSDLRKRHGWLCYRTDVPRGWKDVCPRCQQGRSASQ